MLRRRLPIVAIKPEVDRLISADVVTDGNSSGPENGSMMRSLISYSFLLQPTVFLVIAIAGALVGVTGRRFGSVVAVISLLLLYLLSTPAMSTFLLNRLIGMVPEPQEFGTAQAIVVLGGDERYGGNGQPGDTVGPLTLERLAAAARLYRRLHLPIAVTGGPVDGHRTPLAELMSDELDRDFSVPTKWVEVRSDSTYQNALYTSHLLRNEGIDTVIVVTQEWHLPRALWSFQRVGMKALPFSRQLTSSQLDIGMLLPSVSAQLMSFYAIHEAIGLVYYHLVD